MDTRQRTSSILLILLILAVAIVWSLPDQVTARSLFQSSVPVVSPDTDTPEPTATEEPTWTPEPSITAELSATEEPSSTPAATVQAESTLPWTPTPGPIPSPLVPAPTGVGVATTPTAALGTPVVIASPLPTETALPPAAPTAEAQSSGSTRLTPSGYLPAPTLTSPETAAPALGSGLLPGSQPPFSAPAAAPPAPTNAGVPANASVPSAAKLIDNGILALSYVWLCCGALFLLIAALATVLLVRRSRRK